MFEITTPMQFLEIRMCDFGPVLDQPYFLVPVIYGHPTEQNVRSSSNFWIQFEALKSSHTSVISTVTRENEGV